jgi:hypothetical protein
MKLKKAIFTLANSSNATDMQSDRLIHGKLAETVTGSLYDSSSPLFHCSDEISSVSYSINRDIFLNF